MNITPDRYDAIVVGVGGMGSATVYRLAERGLDVLGIERFDVPHTHGSSHGSTRIVRLTQPEDPSYVPLARAAYDNWAELERQTGRTLITRTGSIHASAPEAELFTDARQSVETHGIEHEILTGATVNERFPGYDLPSEYRAVYQPDGGFVDCEQAVIAHVEAAHEAGATVRARERVLDWRETRNGVRLKTDKGVYEADDVVFTTGAWTGDILPEIAHELTPVRRIMAWFQPKKPDWFQPETLPVFSLAGERGNGYGFPVHDVPGFKFGREPALPNAVDPDEMPPEPTAAEEELHREFADAYFPDGGGPTLRLRTCVYTASTDGHFVLGSHPNRDGVHVAAGFTGHGFKFTAVIGDVLADFVVNGTTDHTVELHRIERLLNANE
ncbi:N-methyl-L-tryptophan oxidase [Halocatena marina]|uniref:N-methyl-L-tryptophan oxidase n=1 Tax=Halocatena marina TaxID=2934937 RepID=UPI002224D2DA|nr:N-methyl-L-tryptophan oxidase [Halocatena marina]